jgi:OPA family glycerol-3-phosphate transporter-like MFS transporter
MKKMITGKTLAWLFAYVYFASYVTRINFSAVIQEVVTSTGFEKSALSIILVCMSISYGVGQIINGWIGDHIKPQNLIFIGLITATTINIVFPFFSSSIPTMCILWTINGFAQAMMWPPIVKIMVNTMDEATYGTASVIVSLGSSFGTIAVYLLAPLIITVLSWKFVLFASATIGLISVIIWGILKDRTYDENAARPFTPTPTTAQKQKFSFPRIAVFPLVFIALAIVFQGMLRDGVTNWMPSYMMDTFNMTEENSILTAVIPAVFSIIGFAVFGKLQQKLIKNEVLCAAAIFVLAKRKKYGY